jgi:hypothetical protein
MKATISLIYYRKKRLNLTWGHIMSDRRRRYCAVKDKVCQLLPEQWARGKSGMLNLSLMWWAISGEGCRSSSAVKREAGGIRILTLPNGIPSHDTFGRVFALLDPQEFQNGFLGWIQAISNLTAGQVVAIDGKRFGSLAARGSTSTEKSRAWSTRGCQPVHAV